MDKKLPFFNLLISFLIVFIFGCNGAGENPAMPSSDSLIPGEDLTSQAGLPSLDNGSGQTTDANSDSDYRILWGYYDVYLDIESRTAEIVPLRNSSFTLNIAGLLQAPFGDPANFGISLHDASQFLTNGLIDVDISVTHPIPGDPNTRAFDLMVLIMGNGSVNGVMEPMVTYPASDGSDLILRNADGYSRWMNAVEFTDPGLFGFTEGAKGIPGFSPSATINGYKWYSKDLGITEDIATFCSSPGNVDLRGTFPAGSTLSRRFELQFPMSVTGNPVIQYQYAVLVSWAPPTAPAPPIPAISDFPPAANLQEAFHMDISDNGSDLYYISPSDNGGNLRLRIEVFDWQGVGNPAGVIGELLSLYVEDSTGTVIPGGFLNILPFVSGTGGCNNSVVLTVDIPGCVPQGTGPQEFLVTAVSASPHDYNNGFTPAYPPAALASYARTHVNVGGTNPCPQPTITSLQQNTVNVNDVIPGFAINGTNFQSGANLSAEFQRSSGDITGANNSVISSSSATSDFDFTGAIAGTYDFSFVSGCGTAAPLTIGALEVNTPPTSTGITGPASGDATTGIVTYNANASDTDTDPVDALTYSWTVKTNPGGSVVVGPATGDPFIFNISSLAIGNYDVECVVSDGYTPADITLTYPIIRNNTQPTVNLPAGPVSVWWNAIQLFNTGASDADPGQTLTYMWSIVPQASPPNYMIPGDPTPGDVTIDLIILGIGTGWHDLSCEVDDGSGAPNAKGQSPVLSIYVASPPYADPIPASMLSQVITPGMPSLQGLVGCPNYWDSFYGPMGMVPFNHPDISVLSGPSLGMPGVMMIADELAFLTGAFPGVTTGFAHFTCPYVSGNVPSWTWTTGGLWPGAGFDMIPSIVHFDGSSTGEIFTTSSMMTGKMWPLADDPSIFSHYIVGGGPSINDLYTSLPLMMSPDVAADTTAGFDMGSPSSPMFPPLYGMYTQELSGILGICGGKWPGAIMPFPVTFLQFPSGAVQPPGMPVDAPGSIAVVAQLPVGLVGFGPGMFSIFPGGPSPSGGIPFPEPYYALAIDDDPADNLFNSNLPQPVNQWVIAAAIDSDRDVEIYEIDYGVAPPGPAPITPLMTIPFGSFLGGSPSAFALDCEFISNFAGFGGTIKPVYQEDLLAVLVTETMGGFFVVEIYSLAGGVPTMISPSMPVPVPPAMYGVPGVAYHLDVDEVTGDIYIIHDDSMGSGSMSVTIVPY